MREVEHGDGPANALETAQAESTADHHEVQDLAARFRRHRPVRTPIIHRGTTVTKLAYANRQKESLLHSESFAMRTIYCARCRFCQSCHSRHWEQSFDRFVAEICRAREQHPFDFRSALSGEMGRCEGAARRTERLLPKRPTENTDRADAQRANVRRPPVEASRSSPLQMQIHQDEVYNSFSDRRTDEVPARRGEARRFIVLSFDT